MTLLLFFIDKMVQIRQTVFNLVSDGKAMFSLHLKRTTLVNLALYHSQDNASLTKIALHLWPATCCLFTLPISFFNRMALAVPTDSKYFFSARPWRPQKLNVFLERLIRTPQCYYNYKPISNLPLSGKIIDRAVFQHLNAFLVQNIPFNGS